ncbi:kinesin-like protein KIF16B [Tetranychus urticae]|uniref:Kinesin-like protein n=1 Tax=Tetranychus urticae TaxID=32264 RepID=T1JPN4_TETUR|nr:kinesin-like protein KIF16B [Tetranychus urticae]
MASVKVAVRVRPFNNREIEMGSSCIIRMEGKKTAIINPNPRPDLLDNTASPVFDGSRKEFTFDHSYWSFDESDKDFSSQEEVYEDLGKPVVEDAFEGYNACIFAYGQTGSGKTFTMIGSPGNEGLIPRICKNLFVRMKMECNKESSYRTEVSYLEIYNERVKDLLGKGDQSLKVREHPKLGPYVQDLSKHLVTDFRDVEELMARGNARRTTASTGMNDTSSRSHAIFTIAFSQATFAGKTPRETLSKINLVDLAGSERAMATGASGQRLKEGGHINKSLVTVGSVIKALAESSQQNSSPTTPKHVFIPYRDSVLTWLLKDSLGGNSKTVMIATLSPADCNYSETLSTLHYANRAKNIINKPTINEDTNTKLIRDLRAEIDRLKSLLGDHPTFIEKVHENEAKVKMLTEEWTEKWKETQRILKEQKSLGLRKAGLGIILDSDCPHLLSINDGLLSSGMTLYQLKEGRTRIGTEYGVAKQDINLQGFDIEDEHCYIDLEDGVATLTPINNSLCFINTIRIEEPTRLVHGCVIMLGRNNMFRFNDPGAINKLKTGRNDHNSSLLNLSKIMSHSTELAKSWDNLWSQVNEGEVFEKGVDLVDIEEKRREIEELEEEHRRAEQRRIEEQRRADQELEIKRKDLEKLIKENELLEKKRIETETELKMMREEMANISVNTGDETLEACTKCSCSDTDIEISDSNGLNDETRKKLSNGDRSDDQIDIKLFSPSVTSTPCQCNNNNGISEEKSLFDKLSELKAFEERLIAMEKNLNEQKSLFEMQRAKELSQIQKEKDNLIEMEKQAELDMFIEREVQRRLRDHQMKCEKTWREGLESRANDYLRITTSSPTLMLAEEMEEDEDQVHIKIPSYKWIERTFDSHYEYTIIIYINGHRLTIHRRYRQFREFHLSLERTYGTRETIMLPYFPPRKMFWTKSLTSLAEERRKSLEKYLRKIIPMFIRIHDCPLNYKAQGAKKLSLSHLLQFSNFFKDDVPDIED